MDAKELMKMAIEARQNAYAPYSHFADWRSAEAEAAGLYRLQYRKRQLRLNLLCGTQRHICGSCAGERRFKMLAVAADSPEPVAPCGACRQVIAEFGIPLVVMGNLKEETKTMTAEELLLTVLAGKHE